MGILANTALEEGWEKFESLGGGCRMRSKGKRFSCKYKGLFRCAASSVAAGLGIILACNMMRVCILVAF